MDVYLTSIVEDIDDIASANLLKYYRGLLQRSIIFYAAFVAFLIASILFIVGFIMRIIQKGIYNNKKTLKFVPEGELRRKIIASIMMKIKY